MTKQILIPSVLLMAAGCSTQIASFDDYDLDDANAQSMSEESLPGLHGDALDGMVEQIVDAIMAEKGQKDLLSKVYAEPVEVNDEGVALSDTCGINPEINAIQLLDSNCRDLNRAWGWEIEVENCEIDGEIFDGTLQLSYDELVSIPPFFPADMVALEVRKVLDANAAGFASARYALDLESPDYALDACGEEVGPPAFRFSETQSHLFSFSAGVLETTRTNGVTHEMVESVFEPEMHTISNGEGVYEITLEDGDRSLVKYRVFNVNTLDGDQWPNHGRIEAHVEGVGSVTLVFTEQSPVDGSVEILTHHNVERANLPMD